MDFFDASKRGLLREQTHSKPTLIRELVPIYDDRVRQLLDHQLCFQISKIVAGGSGDSYNAPLSVELFFNGITKIPFQALMGMHLGRYTLPFIQSHLFRNLLVVGISVSGRVSRTIEAIRLARNLGAMTIGITGNPVSPLAEESSLVFHSAVPDPVDPPHVRTFIGSLISLYSIALRLAEVKGSVTSKEAQQWQKQLLHAADVAEETYDLVSEPVRQLATHLKNNSLFLFSGSGPAYGLALYSAAKIAEATGLDAVTQDNEEWLHIQRYDQGHTASFVIAPKGLGYSRAVNLAQSMKQVGRYVIAIVEEGDNDIVPYADVVLPVRGHVPEVVAPLVFSSAIEMFASDLAQLLGEPYMRAFIGPWEAHPIDDPIIKADKILNSVDELDLSNSLNMS